MSNVVSPRACLLEFAGWTLRVEPGVVWSSSASGSEPIEQPEVSLPSALQGLHNDSFWLATANQTGSDTAAAVTDQPPSPAGGDTATEAADSASEVAEPFVVPTIKPPSREEILAPVTRRNAVSGVLTVLVVCSLVAMIGWRFVGLPDACWLPGGDQLDTIGRLAAGTVASRIVVVESNGDAKAKNKLSSATGAGQFLDGTWLDMIRAHRPDLAQGSNAEILALRFDPRISREMVARFAEQNAVMLANRCLPVTPGTLYLSHFAGGAGAAAVLSAPEHADAASTMANADSTGRSTREMIVKANPFLASYTVADLKSWADRKMGVSRSH